MSTDGTSCTLRHHEVRSFLAKAIKKVRYYVEYKHEGGLNDDRKPGDIIACNWKGNKHLLIVVAITNRLAATVPETHHIWRTGTHSQIHRCKENGHTGITYSKLPNRGDVSFIKTILKIQI